MLAAARGPRSPSVRVLRLIPVYRVPKPGAPGSAPRCSALTWGCRIRYAATAPCCGVLGCSIGPASCPDVLEHLLHFIADFAIAGKHHVRVLAGGMHIALRHGPHGGRRTVRGRSRGFVRARACRARCGAPGISPRPDRQRPWSACTRANLFPVEREQPFDNDELARFEALRLSGARVSFEIVDGLFDGFATAKLAHVFDQQG